MGSTTLPTSAIRWGWRRRPNGRRSSSRISWTTTGWIWTTDWDPSKGFEHNKEIVRAVYQWYTDMHHGYEYMHWTGLAKMAGGRVWEGLMMAEKGKDLAFGVGGTAIANQSAAPNGFGPLYEAGGGPLLDTGVGAARMQEAFLVINRDIFTDLAWHHKAYGEKGFREIQERFAAGELDRFSFRAWKLITEGRSSGDDEALWAGNVLFAYREQRDVVNPGYDLLNEIAINGVPLVTAMSFMAKSPVPGGEPFRNVANWPPNISGFYGQRWRWITEDMWPKWRTLGQDKRLNYTAMSLDELADR